VFEVGRPVAFEVDGEDIEAGFDIAGRKLAQIVAGQAAEDAAFAGVDGEVGGRDLARAAGFDFDETEGVALRYRRPGNEVEVARGARGVPRAGDDDVAAAHEPEEGSALAFEAEPQVFGAVGAATVGSAFDGVDRRFHEVDADPEEHWGHCRWRAGVRQRTMVMGGVTKV